MAKIVSYKQLELANALDKARERSVWVVADARVKNMLPQWLQFSSTVFWLQRPEEQKTVETFAEASDFFLKQGVQRGHHLYAVGGGATTDFGGFLAAALHRGMRWTAVPTTLMGMVDAAIGGKTALNTLQGKNLLGAFHDPEEVWISTEFLRTLPTSALASGKGEIIKYGLLDREIHDMIMSPKVSMDALILKCANYKQGVVDRDFREGGERVFLNLGHTVGHALEFALKIPHGIAVAMGMLYLFKALGLVRAEAAFSALARKQDMDEDTLDLRNYPRFDRRIFWSALEHDKKRADNMVNLVVVDDVGAPRTMPMPLLQLRHKLEALDAFKG
jgi:3-dehydroquinate synthase